MLWTVKIRSWKCQNNCSAIKGFIIRYLTMYIHKYISWSRDILISYSFCQNSLFISIQFLIIVLLSGPPSQICSELFTVFSLIFADPCSVKIFVNPFYLRPLCFLLDTPTFFWPICCRPFFSWSHKEWIFSFVLMWLYFLLYNSLFLLSLYCEMFLYSVLSL